MLIMVIVNAKYDYEDDALIGINDEDAHKWG
jgi:hypothetical protein